ncbi:hypothetical protein QFC20_003491 [Naganishia adeliensis]|uniref:Uncharacterized protein n=1 Tax=Naganishia adeliensis TaxID=92952 RepID=A0ACC2WB35_9TREE|nr:hypothetical protein QFC20_003491 [Naganishia adeliensis]
MPSTKSEPYTAGGSSSEADSTVATIDMSPGLERSIRYAPTKLAGGEQRMAIGNANADMLMLIPVLQFPLHALMKEWHK